MKYIVIFALLVCFIGCSEESGDPASILTYSDGINVLGEFSGNQFSAATFSPTPDSAWYLPRITGSVEIKNISDANITYQIELGQSSPTYYPTADTVQMNNSAFVNYMWMDESTVVAPLSVSRPVDIFWGDGRRTKVDFHYEVVADIIPGEGTYRFSLDDTLHLAKNSLGVKNVDYMTDTTIVGEDTTYNYYCDFLDGYEAGLKFELNDVNQSMTPDSLDTIMEIIISDPYIPTNGKRGLTTGGNYAGSFRAEVETEFGFSENGYYDQTGIGFVYTVTDTVDTIHIFAAQ